MLPPDFPRQVHWAKPPVSRLHPVAREHIGCPQECHPVAFSRAGRGAEH